MFFWERFYNLCINNNTTPNAVCKEIGLSTAAATHWKNGSMPAADILIKISEQFNISVDYLLGNESNTSELPEQDKKMLDMLHRLNKTGKEKAEQYLELLSLQYGTSDEDEIDEMISAIPDKKDNTVTARIAAFGGGVHEIKLSKDDLKELINMLEEEES